MSHLTGMDRQEKATTKMAAFKHTLPARPRPGLSAEFQVHRERKGNSGLSPTQKNNFFFLLGGEKMLVPLCHTLALTQVTAASQSRHRRRLSPFPNTHLPPASWAGTLARGAGADGCNGAAESESFSCCSCALVSAGLRGRHRHDRQTCTHCPRARVSVQTHVRTCSSLSLALPSSHSRGA